MASIPEKLHHCQRSKKLFTWHVTSFITENKPHAHQNLQHSTIAVLLIEILIFFYHSLVITCSKVYQPFLNLIPKLSLQNIRGFDQATILSPSFHGLCNEHLAQWPPFRVPNMTKVALQIMSLTAYASETDNCKCKWVVTHIYNLVNVFAQVPS